MDDYTKKKAIVDALNGDSDNKYYVYALCEKTEDGKLIPFYVGKGEGDRVWAHEEGQEKEIEYIKNNYDEEDQKIDIDDLSEKYKRITLLGSDRIEKIIVKWGMTSDEAFMAESALINLLKISGLNVSMPDNQLTNIANGHSSKGEKLNGCRTEAMTLDQYFTKCALPPLDFSDLKNVVLISINKGYPQCMELEESKQKDAIREMVRGFWKLKVDHPDYLYAMYHQRVVGVYRIKKQYKEVKSKRKTKSVQTLYSVLDVWRDDYPTFANLQIRENDYNFAKTIYDACETTENGEIQKVITYDELSEELKAFVKHWSELEDGKSIKKKYENFIKRKYYVLEEIKDTDPDPDRREHLGRRIVEYKDKGGKKVPTSPIPPRNYIRYSKE